MQLIALLPKTNHPFESPSVSSRQFLMFPLYIKGVEVAEIINLELWTSQYLLPGWGASTKYSLDILSDESWRWAQWRRLWMVVFYKPPNSGSISYV